MVGAGLTTFRVQRRMEARSTTFVENRERAGLKTSFERRAGAGEKR